ncbi:restriction endonuclease [Pseudomonas sp. NPDC089569]|uniref:nSTAND3 domain-containing NTPase n=1 Tax=Pseudomonas sp. NPDC089569 TaxID=3390722 RepID=UPI003D06A8DC
MNLPSSAQAAYQPDFALHTLGWKAFQDLCAQVCSESLHRAVSTYREAQDGGQDAVFLLEDETGLSQEATVQCKFSGKPERRLKVSDICSELESVASLVQDGRATSYYLITNMGVDAPVAANIRDLLKAHGVQSPHVFGKEWLTTEIRASARLRALVPRVYGLGDLSSIIDERCATQTRALLGHLLPSLRIYVPTDAHRAAVKVLGEHRLVLLLGAPAAGKSMLAAILATMAADTDQLECFKCDGPLEIKTHWNPNEPKRLFWVDDAFGPNQMREDYVDSWIEFLPKMKTALEQGCYFILTSRTHIWNEAKLRLGTRNHQLLASGKATVQVGQLLASEREQILYNHIKAGVQPHDWKSRVKPHLTGISEDLNLLPEIARRLGDPTYTSAIKKLPDDLIRFINHPQDFLKDTINELATPQLAAMTIVFLSRSRLPVQGELEGIQMVADKFGTSEALISQAFLQLKDSFLTQKEENHEIYWSFIHPTFADAISSILSARPDLVGFYLKGAKTGTILTEAVCDGAPSVKDAVLIRTAHFETLAERLLEIPNEPNENENLFSFLSRRAPLPFLKRLIELEPELLRRRGRSGLWHKIAWRAEYRTFAQAHSMLLLPEDVRSRSCVDLERAALKDWDISFFPSEEILSLFRPHELITLTVKILDILNNHISQEITDIEEDVDLDFDIEDQFLKVTSFIKNAEVLAINDEDLKQHLRQLSYDARVAISACEHRQSEDQGTSVFFDMPTAEAPSSRGQRSTFSDIDED